MALKLAQYLRQGDTFTINTTYQEDLPKTGFLSALLIEVTGTPVNGATLGTEAWRLLDFLKKVEIIGNGAQPIVSCDWNALLYANYLDQMKLPPTIWRNYATTTQREMVVVPFGRFMWDTDFGLDCSKWNRVQVKVTNNGSGTYFTGNLSINILMMLLDDLPAGFARGYLRKEEFRKWTTLQNTWEYIELPTAYPLRGVHLRLLPDLDGSFVSETSMSNCADDVKFAIQDRKKFLHDGGIFHRMMLNYLEYPGQSITAGFVDKTADIGFDLGLGYTFGVAGMSGAKDGAGSATIPTLQGDNNNNTQVAETREADSPLQLMAIGMSPHNFLTLHYNREVDPAMLLDPARHGQITLDVHTRDAASAADATNTVVLDSVVSAVR